MLQTRKQGKNNRIGALGEALACRFMRNNGFVLIQQNYLQKWGEIDLIMQKAATVHFIEVKTVSHETQEHLKRGRLGGYRPEEQLTAAKYQRLERTINTWLQAESYKGQYQLDLVAVRVVPAEMYAQIEYYERIVVG